MGSKLLIKDDLIMKGKFVDWESNIGNNVRFIYNSIEGYIKILSKDGDIVRIKYKDREYEISRRELISCKIGRILGNKTSDFKFNVGNVIEGKNGIITITNRYKEKSINNGQNMKYYEYECNKCGFNSATNYYIKGVLSNNYRILESGLVKKVGCACCNHSSKIVVPHINSIVSNDENKWMIDYVVGGYNEAKKYTHRSEQLVDMVCPDCGSIKKYSPDKLYTNKCLPCNCSDGISLGEKMVFNVLDQLGVDFIWQLSKVNLNWCKDYRYDFYIKDTNTIIEVQGKQHMNTKHFDNTSFNTCGGKNNIEENINDINKYNNAVKNVDNYIYIDASKTDFDFIKGEILNSKLKNMFNLTLVDWDICSKYSVKNIIREVCVFWNNKDEHQTSKDLSIIFKLRKVTIIDYLKKGAKLGWCEYNPKEEMRKSAISNIKSKYKQVEVFKDNISLGVFETVTELDKQSEELFGVKLDYRNISSVANGKRKHHKGFTFKYVDTNKEEMA